MGRFVPAGVLDVMVAGLVAADYPTDTLDAMKENVAAGKAVVVDVREAGEWADGHL